MGVLSRNLRTSSLKSTATPRISAFWLLRCILILLSSGISRRHGAHQVAQKFTINGRPPKLAMRVGLPFKSASVISGNVSGIAFFLLASSMGAAGTLFTGDGTAVSDPLG